MGKEFPALSEAFLTTWRERIPECFDSEVMVCTWDDGNVASGGMSDFRAVTGEFEVYIWHGGRILSRIRDIDHGLERKGGLGGIQDT